VFVIATAAKQLDYLALRPSELQSTARLHVPLWQKHRNGTKCCPWELDHAGAGLLNLRFFPILLSKLLTSVLSFTSYSNFMTSAQHAYECCTVEEDLLLQHRDCLLSQDTIELSSLIHFCNGKSKPVKPPAITHP